MTPYWAKAALLILVGAPYPAEVRYDARHILWDAFVPLTMTLLLDDLLRLSNREQRLGFMTLLLKLRKSSSRRVIVRGTKPSLSMCRASYLTSTG